MVVSSGTTPSNILLIGFILVVIAYQKYGDWIQIHERRRMTMLDVYADPKSTNSKHNLPPTGKWRVLNFGTSVSWGASLHDRLHEAYPYLISPDATNLAIRAQGPSYPSVCTQTMVGDDTNYNVILLEFYLRATEGLELLTRRLRQRFPQAVIIIIRRWNPLMFRYRPTNTGLKDWMEQHNFAQKLHDPEFHRYLFQHTQSDDWILYSSTTQQEVQEKVAQKYGAWIYSLPTLDDPRENLTILSRLFSKDMNHLSAEGHALVAKGIRDLIDQSGVLLNNDNLVGEVRDWKEHDLCDTWYWSGESTTPISYEPSIHMTQFDPKNHKWALEIPEAGGGWITVENPFDDIKLLAITVMGTTPPRIYPLTRVILDVEGHPESIMEIDPTVVDPNHFGTNVHVGITKILGSVPPGTIRMKFDPVEKNKERPLLRITGYALTDLDFDVESLRYIRNVHPV